MKLKSLSFTLLSLSLSLIYITMSSDINGTYQNGTSCSSCHGNANTATTVAMTGLPNNFITNQTYTLTFTVTNQTLSHAGFNIKCSAGTFTAGTGSHVNTSMNQITHNSPLASTSSSAPFTETFTFSWKAPSTNTAVTFNCAGNAVNNDGNDSNADQWNSATYTISGSFPTFIPMVNHSGMDVYPNPSQDVIYLTGMAKADNVEVYTLLGQRQKVDFKGQGNNLTLDISMLPLGSYFMRADLDGKMFLGRFEKQ